MYPVAFRVQVHFLAVGHGKEQDRTFRSPQASCLAGGDREHVGQRLCQHALMGDIKVGAHDPALSGVIRAREDGSGVESSRIRRSQPSDS